jgi:O-antigen ligase
MSRPDPLIERPDPGRAADERDPRLPTRRGSPGGAAAASAAAVFIFLVAFAAGSDPEAGRKLALVACAAIAIGLVFGVLPRSIPTRDSWPLLAGLVLLLALSALALTWTTSIERTLDEVARIAGFAALVVLGLLALRRRRWRAIAAGLAIGATAVCGLAVVARVFPDVISPASLNQAGDRLAYPLGYWNALAAWSAATITMLLAWAVDGRDRIVRSTALGAVPVVGTCLYLTYSRGGLLTALLGAAVVIGLTANRPRAMIYAPVAVAAIAAVAIVIHLHAEIARGEGAYGGPAVGATLAAACALSVYVGRRWRLSARAGTRRGRRRERTPINRRRALAAVVAGVVVVIAVPLAYAVVDDGEPVAAETQADPAARLLNLEGNRPRYWEAALDAFASEPVKGLAPGTYEFWWSQNGEGPELVRDAHAFYLEQLAELGLPGLLGGALTAGGILWLALGPLRRGEAHAASIAMPAAVAVLVSYLAIDWIWESNAVMVLALSCTVAAGASGAVSLHRNRPFSSRSRSGSLDRPRQWPRVIVGVMAVAGAAVQVPGIVSAGRIERSNSALEAGLAERATELASEAIDAAPWAATPYSQRAFAESSAGEYRSARTDILRAVDREPENFRLWLALAAYEARLGSASAARSAYRHAVDLAPRAPAVIDRGRRDLHRIIEDLEQGGDGGGTLP